MSKILVDVMPEKAEECPFAEYIQMTSKNACRLQSGMYSRCDLECGKKCEKLMDLEEAMNTMRYKKWEEEQWIEDSNSLYKVMEVHYMKCRCGSKARCIGKEPEYYYEVVVGVRRRYECKKCGTVFETVEKREETCGNWDGPVIFNGER